MESAPQIDGTASAFESDHSSYEVRESLTTEDLQFTNAPIPPHVPAPPSPVQVSLADQGELAEQAAETTIPQQEDLVYKLNHAGLPLPPDSVALPDLPPFPAGNPGALIDPFTFRDFTNSKFREATHFIESMLEDSKCRTDDDMPVWWYLARVWIELCNGDEARLVQAGFYTYAVNKLYGELTEIEALTWFLRTHKYWIDYARKIGAASLNFKQPMENARADLNHQAIPAGTLGLIPE